MDNIQTNSGAPFFRIGETPRRMMLDTLIALWIALIPAIFISGFRSLIMAALGVLGAVAAEVIWQFIRREPQTVGDLSAVVTGLCCALLLPAGCPVWLPALSAAFGTVCAKLAFGGLGRSPFDPAAAGTCFAFLIAGKNITDITQTMGYSAQEKAMWKALPDRVFFSIPEKSIVPLFGNFSFKGLSLFDSLDMNSQLRAGIDPHLTFSQFLFGTRAGALGTTCVLALAVSALWLIARRSMAWRACASYLVSIAVISFIFPHRQLFAVVSPLYDVFACGSVFFAVFLIGSRLTAPKMRSGQVLYGAAAGILTVLLRHLSEIGYSDVFAVMLCGIFSGRIDRFVWFCRSHGISYTATKRSMISKIKARANREEEPADEV